MRSSAVQKYHLATHRTQDSNQIHFHNVHCLMDVYTCLNRSVSEWQKDQLYDIVQPVHYSTMYWVDRGLTALETYTSQWKCSGADECCVSCTGGRVSDVRVKICMHKQSWGMGSLVNQSRPLFGLYQKWFAESVGSTAVRLTEIFGSTHRC